MKVHLVLDSVSREGGGITEAERRLHQHLASHGVRTSVYALRDAFSEADLSAWLQTSPRVFPVRGPGALGASPALWTALRDEPADLIYRAGLWRLPSYAAARWKRKHGKPEVIAPHGMLDPWAVRNSRWKKVMAKALYEGRHLRDASCIRALCASEVDSIRAFGLKNPVCLVPNGVELPEEQADSGLPAAGTGRKKLLFLGRLHPKKGLAHAIKAWKEIRKEDGWQFVIAGWDQGGHEAELKRLCREAGIAASGVPVAAFLANREEPDVNEATVLFVGPAFGRQKDELLRLASAFILPSFSEGLPMSVLEAWAYRLPVLMTDHCNLPEGFAAGAAIRIGTDETSIAEGLRLLLQSPASDLRSLGANGRKLVESRFSWQRIAADMKEVYDWLLGGTGKPGCVTR